MTRKVMHVMNGAGGGAAHSTLALAEAFRSYRIESCAVCADMGSKEERAAVREAMRGEAVFVPLYWWNQKVRAAAWKRPLLELHQGLKTRAVVGSVREVVRQARTWGADLIHTNTLLTPEGGLAAAYLGLPHVWHVRELVGEGMPFRFPIEGRFFGRVLQALSSTLVANSSVTADHLRPWLPHPARLTTIHNGIDPRGLGRLVPRERPDVLVVSMVGNLTSRSKKHHLFVDMAALVPPDLAIEFRLYGQDGGAGDEYSRELRNRAQRGGAAARIRFCGFEANIERAMAESDLVVHPAEQESFGRVVVEAMLAGRPVVGVRGGGVGELVVPNETGLLVSPDSPQELAAAVDRLARSPQLRLSMGAQGRKVALEKYTLEACAKRVAEVYGQVQARPLDGYQVARTLMGFASA